jgi:hypothetical protein
MVPPRQKMSQSYQSDLTRRANHQNPVKPLSQKYSAFQKHQISFIPFHVPPRQQGRIAIVTDVGRDVVDVGLRADERASRGRPSRVVLTPRGWRQVGGAIRLSDGVKKA